MRAREPRGRNRELELLEPGDQLTCFLGSSGPRECAGQRAVHQRRVGREFHGATPGGDRLLVQAQARGDDRVHLMRNLDLGKALHGLASLRQCLRVIPGEVQVLGKHSTGPAGPRIELEARAHLRDGIGQPPRRDQRPAMQAAGEPVPVVMSQARLEVGKSTLDIALDPGAHPAAGGERRRTRRVERDGALRRRNGGRACGARRRDHPPGLQDVEVGERAPCGDIPGVDCERAARGLDRREDVARPAPCRELPRAHEARGRLHVWRGGVCLGMRRLRHGLPVDRGPEAQTDAVNGLDHLGAWRGRHRSAQPAHGLEDGVVGDRAAAPYDRNNPVLADRATVRLEQQPEQPRIVPPERNAAGGPGQAALGVVGVVIAGFVEQHVHPVLAALTMNAKVISIEDWDAIEITLVFIVSAASTGWTCCSTNPAITTLSAKVVSTFAPLPAAASTSALVPTARKRPSRTATASARGLPGSMVRNSRAT